MKKFAAAIARNKGIKAPAGYTQSAAVCRAFLDGYAPKRGSGADAGSGGGGASTVASGEGRAEREADVSTNQRRHGEAQIVPSRVGRNSRRARPLRIPYGNKEATAFEARSECTAREQGWFAPAGASTCPKPFGSGAGCSDFRNVRGQMPLAVATIPWGTGGARARAREAWSGGKTVLRRRRRPTRVRG